MPINKSVCGACGAKRFKWPLKSIGKVSVTQLAGGGGEPRQTTFPIKSDWAKCQRELCAVEKCRRYKAENSIKN